MKYGAAASRRAVIMRHLQASGFAATGALARDMDVSEMTVRRDLLLLHGEGSVMLVHGGAALPMAARISSFGSRQMVNAEAKRRIAVRALQWLQPADTVALDAGTTACALAEALPADFTGCVVTSSIPIVHSLMDRSLPRVITLGGEVDGISRACVGPMAVEAARQLRVRTFFLGAAALDRHGIYVEADLERPTKLALMAIADRVVLLADHSKFGRSALLLLCPLTALAGIVTDAPPSPALQGVLRRARVKVDVASRTPG